MPTREEEKQRRREERIAAEARARAAAIPSSCETHVGVIANGVCPVCLINERDKLRELLEQEKEWSETLSNNLSIAMHDCADADTENDWLRTERDNLMDGVAFMQQLIDERDEEIARLNAELRAYGPKYEGPDLNG